MVILWVTGQQDGLVPGHAGLGQRVNLGADLLLVAVADALVEQQREDIAAKFGVVGIATQDVGGLVEVGFKLALGHAPRGADDDRRLELGQQFLQIHGFSFTSDSRFAQGTAIPVCSCAGSAWRRRCCA